MDESVVHTVPEFSNEENVSVVDTNDSEPGKDVAEVEDSGQLVEAVLATEFTSKLSQTVLTLLVSETIKPDSNEWSGFTVDVNKAVPLLKRIKERQDTAALEPSSANTEFSLSLEEIQHAFLASLESLAKGGYLTPELMINVSKILDETSIDLSDRAFARFAYLGDAFPTEENKKGIFEVGKKIVQQYTEKISSAAQKVELQLSAEQAKAVALRLMTSHEYGHAVHKTIKINKLEAALALNSDNRFGEQSMKVEKDVDSAIHTQISPNQEMEKLFSGEVIESEYDNNNPLLTVSERVAMGFQEIGTEQALLEIGLSPEQVQAMMTALRAEESQLLRETTLTLTEAKSRGFSMKTLGDAVNNLASDVYNSDKDLYELLRSGFSARNFGYYFPLKPDEIKQLAQL